MTDYSLTTERDDDQHISQTLLISEDQSSIRMRENESSSYHEYHSYELIQMIGNEKKELVHWLKPIRRRDNAFENTGEPRIQGSNSLSSGIFREIATNKRWLGNLNKRIGNSPRS